MKRYGLIGYPLTHSFSAGYFKKKFTAEGIDAVYTNYPLPNINAFPDLLAREELAGLNVTIPYKEAVLPHLDGLSPEAEQIGAVNTIVFADDGLIGHNTDAPAIAQVLTENEVTPAHKALVFGTGGASKAVCYALKQLGISYQMVSRQEADQALTYATLDAATAGEHQVWINTTPVGQYPNDAAKLPLPYESITQRHICIDLIYNPSETAFLAQAKQNGARVLNGLSMLHYQAEKAWKLWRA